MSEYKMEDYHENVIEFLKEEDTATASLAIRGRLYNEVKKYAKERPDECKIIAKNKDGSIMAHIPVSWINIRPPIKENLTDAQREYRKEHMNNINLKKQQLDD